MRVENISPGPGAYSINFEYNNNPNVPKGIGFPKAQRFNYSSKRMDNLVDCFHKLT